MKGNFHYRKWNPLGGNHELIYCISFIFLLFSLVEVQPKPSKFQTGLGPVLLLPGAAILHKFCIIHHLFLNYLFNVIFLKNWAQLGLNHQEVWRAPCFAIPFLPSLHHLITLKLLKMVSVKLEREAPFFPPIIGKYFSNNFKGKRKNWNSNVL